MTPRAMAMLRFCSNYAAVPFGVAGGLALAHHDWSVATWVFLSFLGLHARANQAAEDAIAVAIDVIKEMKA